MVVQFIFTTKGLVASFTDLSSDIPEGATLKWDFGDGQTSDITNPTHDYAKSGIYLVVLSYLDAENTLLGKYEHRVVLSDKAFTTLTDSIYSLIDTYIPANIVGDMSLDTKRQFINKWQLYIRPLVNRPVCKEIPLEEYSNELYYEALENQLIMELAAYDFTSLKVQNMLLAISEQVIVERTYSSESGDDEGDDNTSGTTSGNIKKITTGPTEVEYFDTQGSAPDVVSSLTKALQPGGIIEMMKDNLCMLAERLSIYLPICRRVNKVKVPKVVNRRIPGNLSGPDPFEILL